MNVIVFFIQNIQLPAALVSAHRQSSPDKDGGDVDVRPRGQ